MNFTLIGGNAGVTTRETLPYKVTTRGHHRGFDLFFQVLHADHPPKIWENSAALR